MSELPNSQQGTLDFKNMKKRVTWDEATIAEHNKERGTRQIINEPKTPYYRLGIPENPEEPQEDNRAELLRRLLELNESRNKTKNAHFAVGESKPTIENTEDEAERHRAFVQKRKAHYNEYQMVLKMREQMKRDEDGNYCGIPADSN